MGVKKTPNYCFVPGLIWELKLGEERIILINWIHTFISKKTLLTCEVIQAFQHFLFPCEVQSKSIEGVIQVYFW